jgi:hypothetical protein
MMRPATEKSATMRIRRNYIAGLLARLRPKQEPHVAAGGHSNDSSGMQSRESQPGSAPWTVDQDPLVRRFVERMLTSSPRQQRP